MISESIYLKRTVRSCKIVVDDIIVQKRGLKMLLITDNDIFLQ